MNYKEFYVKLGDLFYAIAKADGIIDPAETHEIKRIVKEELTQLEESTDKYDSDAAFAAEFEFEILEDWDVSAREAFNSFAAYIKQNPSLEGFFKHVAFISAKRIANSYYGTNLNETAMLNQLQTLLKT